MRSQQIMPLLALALASAVLAALVATLLLTIPTLAQIEEPWNIVVFQKLSHSRDSRLSWLLLTRSFSAFHSSFSCARYIDLALPPAFLRGFSWGQCRSAY